MKVLALKQSKHVSGGFFAPGIKPDAVNPSPVKPPPPPKPKPSTPPKPPKPPKSVKSLYRFED